jgi:hypothetical protein
MGTDTQQPDNDVWGSLAKLGSEAITAQRDVSIARTKAAPSGSIENSGVNPFPGTQGAYPQAEAKPNPGGASFSATIGVTGIVIAVLVVLGFLLLSRR